MRKVRIGSWQLFRERAGIISPDQVWVLLTPGVYMYTGDSLLDLLYNTIRDWHTYRALVG